MKTEKLNFRAKIDAVAEAKTDDFLELVKLSGYSPATDFRFRDLNDADFGGCNLAGFDFTGSRLTRANFKNAKISGAIFDGRQKRLKSIRSSIDFRSVLIINERQFFDLIDNCELNKDGLKSFHKAFDFSKNHNILEAQKVAILIMFCEKFDLHGPSLRRAVREISNSFEFSNFNDQWLYGFLKDPRSYAIHRNTAAAIMLFLAKKDKFSYLEFLYVIQISNLNGRNIISHFEMFPSINDRLINACHQENTAIIENILNQFRDEINFNHLDSHGRTPLNISIKKRNYKQVELLLNSGADPNSRYDELPILLASRVAKRSSIISLLVHRGAKIDSVDVDGNNALMIAVKAGHKEIIKRLLDLELDVNWVGNNEKTALDFACEAGNPLFTEWLLCRGSDVNYVTSSIGLTALMIASEGGYSNVVKLLIKHDADVDQTNTLDGATALILASVNGHTDVVELLLSAGANPTIKDKNGLTAADLVLQKANNQKLHDLLKIEETNWTTNMTVYSSNS